MSTNSPESDGEEAFYAALRERPQQYQDGFSDGWDRAYEELSERDTSSVPPLLRRFYWSPWSTYEDDYRPWFRGRREAGGDEHCNPVVSVRLRGGLLHIRVGRKVRSAKDGDCDDCVREQAEFEEKRQPWRREK